MIVTVHPAVTARQFNAAHRAEDALGAAARPVVSSLGVQSFDTGEVHGPTLPINDPSSPFWHYMRRCSCGAVEDGFPHSWHDRDCARFDRHR